MGGQEIAPANTRLAIRGGAVVAWRNGAHRVLPNATVVVEDERIVSVGTDDSGVGHALDASGMLVLPGFINAHFHGTDTPFTRDFLEESQGERDFGNLYRMLPAIRNAIQAEDALIAARLFLTEALLAGTTTVVEMGYDQELAGSGDLESAEQVSRVAIGLGLRCYSAPRYRNGYWRVNEAGGVEFHDYPDRGRARMEQCISFCRRVDGTEGGRLRAMLAPGQIDTCDAEMLIETRRIAKQLSLPIQIHAGQSPTEYRRVMERQNLSTIEYLARTGLLAPDLLIGHGMFLTESRDVDSVPRDELEALAQSGATIVHLPWVKMRQGSLMNSYEKFLRAGINVALGTDTHPADMIHEMRIAILGCKIAEQNHQATSAMRALELATTNGAQALRRDDLGRIAPGCLADIVLIDMCHPRAAGYEDPIKYLAYNGESKDVRTVLVGGKVVVRDGRPTNADTAQLVSDMKAAKTRVRSRVAI